MCLFTLLQAIIFVLVIALLGFPISDPVLIIGLPIICSLFILFGSIFGCLMLTCTVTKEGIRPLMPFSIGMNWDEITNAKKSFYAIIITGNTFNKKIIFPGPFIVSNKEEVYSFLKKNVPDDNLFLELIKKIKV